MIGFMQKKLYSILLIISIILISLTSVGFAYAWFVDLNQESVDLSGNSSGAYFYDGDGSQENPYLIADKRHMYNLVWLQNNGRLTDSEGNQKKFYFKLYDISSPNGINGNIDMSSIIIPPIGNDTYPFISEFDGNGCQINNLIVSTNFDVIYNGELLKNDSYKFSNSVGLFGLTGANSSVKNFILNNPTVEVYGDDNNYSTTASKVAGLAVGHVEAKASSIGVKGGALSVNRASYETFNSIIGYIKEGVGSDVVGGGSSSSSSPGEGGDVGHFIPDVIRKKINPSIASGEAIDFGVGEMYLSDNDSTSKNTNNYWGLGCFSFVTETQTSAIRSVTANNKTINSTQFRMALDSDGDNNYTIENSSVVVDFSGSTAYESGSIEQSHIDYIKNLDGSLKNNIEYGLYLSKSPASQTITVYNEANPTTAIGTTDKIKTSNIKVNIVNPNSKMFIVASQNNSSQRIIGITKVAEAQTGFLFKEKYTELDDTNYNKTEYDYSVLLGSNMHSAHIAAIVTIKEPGIYNIASTSGGISFNYLAVEGVENGDASTGLVDSTKGASAIDFIYDGVTIAQSAVGEIAAYNFIYNNEAYEKSGTSIYFELSSSENKIVLYFKRELESNEILFKVQYNSKAPSASYASKVSIISGGPELIITSSGISSGGPTFA